MPNLRSYYVRPSLPAALQPLEALARNLWWSWNSSAVDLFETVEPELWRACGHNPLMLLSRVPAPRLESLAADRGFVARLSEVRAQLEGYLGERDTWYARTAQGVAREAGRSSAEQFPSARIAYFSAEFGITESLQIYSGGLGILAGDHLKSASDLGLPLVGVGLLYHEPFHQQIDAEGRQVELHPRADLSMMPVALQRDAHGALAKVRVELPGRTLVAQVWRADVGRVPLLLLDTDLPENRPEDRVLTDRLYGGDLDMRIRQELLLGLGGVRALEVVGLRPAVVHMNEGHAAFSALERLRQIMTELGMSFAEARELAAAGAVFTTHTPVPAGNDRFPPEMMDRYTAEWLATLGISREEFLALGRENPADAQEHFCMTVLALKLAARSNGVAQLHGTVSRAMWQKVYPGAEPDEVPIGSVTNGIHHLSFVSPEMRRLFDRYIGPRWTMEPDAPELWRQVEDIPAAELWRAHEEGRERVVRFARRRLMQQLARHGAGAKAMQQAAEVLDPKALTIGFARRFATYKRATLITRDAERLARILNDAKRPVQILFAGKAHQKDEPGKELIRKVVQLSSRGEFRHRVVFLEDYEINTARHLVQGVDVWLNTPLRPLEASGTSGMKAVLNGCIHASVLDGWWAEAYDPSVGWAIGEAEEYPDNDAAEKAESELLYRLLEREIVPAFYERGPDGLPHRWIRMMKASMQKLVPFFNTDRMVREYCETAYRPAADRYHRLAAHQEQRARALASYKTRLRRQWDAVGVRALDGMQGDVAVGETHTVRALVSLAELNPDDVSVELFHAVLDRHGQPKETGSRPMTFVARDGDAWRYESEIECHRSGHFGIGVRVMPRHTDLASPFEVVPVRWG